MFDYLIGTITDIQATYIVLDCQGIGYRVMVANPYAFTNQKKEGSPTKVFIEQVVREDSMTLYGFKTQDERRLFLNLISVSNIGPKSALSILAIGDHDGLIQAVEGDDVTYLTKFPGVGKKTAQQIILDLKGKLDFASSQASNLVVGTQPTTTNPMLADVLEALAGLGYSQREINRVEKDLAKIDFATTQEGLSLAFKRLIK